MGTFVSGVERMHQDDPVYQVLAAIWVDKHRIPRPHQYRAKTKKILLPSLQEVIQQYGSFDHAVAAFFDTYFAIHGYAEIHDYLLGALTNRGKVVREKRGTNRMYLRFTSSDEEQIELIRAFIPQSTVYLSKKTKPTLYLRCYDDELILAFEHLYQSSWPFRPTLDFVREYIDTHSHFRKTSPTTFRLTITGPLVPQVHDFLVQLGATNTKVYMENDEKDESFRMNVHTKSIRKIRDKLYPFECVYYNERVRAKIYRA